MGSDCIGHDDGTDGAFRTDRNGSYEGYSEKITMNARDYPPDDGMSYRDMSHADYFIQKCIDTSLSSGLSTRKFLSLVARKPSPSANDTFRI